MTDRPIIFSAPMVRALLDGRKTQTRRVLTKRAAIDALAVFGPAFLALPGNTDLVGYAPGDRLWVREAIARQETDQGVGYKTYKADGKDVWPLTQWYHKRSHIPSIHMPRWASRLTLTVTDVRVQRLQEISEADAVAEGVTDQDVGGARGVFSRVWNSLHGPDAWAANPWICALTFTVQRGNIDGIGGAV